ncbi:MAG: D-2-hydroxyacid dehydrogenase [Anaerolineae bacterium]
MPTFLLSLPADRLKLVESFREELVRGLPGMRVVFTADRAEIEQVLDDVEIFAGSVPAEMLARARHLRWFHQWGAGADWLLSRPERLPAGVVLTNMSGLHAVQISEQIMSYILAFARNLHQALRAQQEHRWRPADWNELFELPGKTMLLLGLGGIGARTAKVAAALGLNVVGVRSHPERQVAGITQMHSPEDLPKLWPVADFVVLALPLTPKTRGLVGEKELRTMKSSAYLINIGRGGLVDELALIQALQQGWIAGAGLDVFAHEPLPADSPLWSMENVIITAHYAGRSPNHEEGAMAILLDNVRRYSSHLPLHNVVDPERGY